VQDDYLDETVENFLHERESVYTLIAHEVEQSSNIDWRKPGSWFNQVAQVNQQRLSNGGG